MIVVCVFTLSPSLASGTTDSAFVDCIEQTSHTSQTTLTESAQLYSTRLANMVCFERFQSIARLREADIRSRMFESQIPMTYAILTMVIVLTLSGVALAAVQLLGAVKLANTADELAGRDMTIMVETGKVSITSSFVGLAILFISFGFFYIFVAFVYEIKELPGSNSTHTQPPAQAIAVSGNSGVKVLRSGGLGEPPKPTMDGTK